MTAKEKAKELVERSITYGSSKEVAKLFANKMVDEIINEIYKSSSLDKYYLNNDTMNEVEAINYWQEVKQEIEKL
jgi:hypothetical protein